MKDFVIRTGQRLFILRRNFFVVKGLRELSLSFVGSITLGARGLSLLSCLY